VQPFKFWQNKTFERLLFIGVIATSFAICGCAGMTRATETADAAKADEPQVAEEPALQPSTVETPKGLEKAIFAAGCFWGVERILQQLPGVKATTVGYTGGKELNTNYVLVCAGRTGHAEGVEVFFDPKQISYETLVNKFFDLHDGADKESLTFHGGQYRSAIFYTSDEQKKIAESVMQQRSHREGKKFYTQIVPASDFVVAEDFHQDYYKVRNMEAQCHR
jgi:methionine-S-sulfoxide reductase